MTETTEINEDIAAGVSDAAKAEGEEAMRIAKLNHPEVDWQADPYTGAPLVPGHSAAESAETVTYNPPAPNPPVEEEAPPVEEVAPEATSKKAKADEGKG